MLLHKKSSLTFLILYEILTLITTQEYLKDLKPKDITFISYDELPPVELPKPLSLQRQSRTVNEEQLRDEELTEAEHRLQKSKRPTLMDIALEASVREGLSAMRKLYTIIEPNMVKNGHILQDNHPAALLSKFSAPVVDSSRREMAAYATLTAAKVFRKNYDLNSDFARQAHGERVSLRRTALESLCPPRDPPTCMPASERYRTHDGTCNNKRRLRWGAAQMPFNRFLPPEYGDGVDTIRKAIDEGPLSSSRFVSLLVHGARDGEAALTLMLAQWGQLLDHDLTSTAQPRSINGSVPSCCGSKEFHPSCFPIKVPLDDPWLSPLKVRCLEFLRSAPAQRRDCVLSWREQTNQATSYIDASPIYSSSVKSSDNARAFRKGLLIFGRGNPADDVCQRGAIATHCIRSGDGRSSEQPGLLALHQVWVHEHNLIASKLSEMNLHWSDEKIYQETRRIIGAMFQHITYREFLPIVLGREVIKLFELELLSDGYYKGYDPKINPTVANAFSAAAFRFGHSLVQNSYMRCDRFYNFINNNVSLHEEFQKGDIGSVGSLHRLIRGLATQRALKRDEFITPELTNHLFQTPGFPFGLDLAAINIQRGRDHGIPPYTQWRVPCGLTPINTWQEFSIVVGPESARRISHAYQSVHDIDLFVGGIAERPVIGGLVGSTFACIIAQQFSNSRKGDRFWYENADFESSFTPAQLHSLRRVSLASVLCRAVGGGTFQPHIFLPPQFPNNERLPCGIAPLGDFDISPWLEQDPFASFTITQTSIQQTLPRPTFKPQALPDRIFDIMEMETKSPENINTPLSNNKVGFANRIKDPTTTLAKQPTQLVQVQRPHIEFIPNAENGLLTVKNSTKISDKLDVKRKGTTVHVTKRKPVPGVNNKLDKNNRKGSNKHGVVQSTTRRTVIINNIPIELRHAGRDKVKTLTAEIDNIPESRTSNSEIPSITNKTNVEENEKTKTENFMLTAKVDDVAVRDAELTVKADDHYTSQNLSPEEQNHNIESQKCLDIKVDLKERIKTTRKDSEKENSNTILSKGDRKYFGGLEQTDKIKLQLTGLDSIIDYLKDKTNKTNDSQTTQLTITKHKKLNKQNNSLKSTETETNSSVTDEQADVTNKIMTITKYLQNNTLPVNKLINQSLYDSDIDPIVQAKPIDHKRVQRKLISPSLTEKVKEKLKLTHTNTANRGNISLATTIRILTTKTPKPSRTTQRTFELRQYQNRPSFTKTPQKLIVDSVNGDNQYEIEINIRQTNKNPKPLPSTPYVADYYTNSYKPNQFERYTPNYQTTPIHAYYKPAPTQISVLQQNQRTKPPTIIFVNEPDERKTTKQPGFLQSIVGWNLGTKRPLPTSIGLNERPGFESIIGSPLSTAGIQPAYQNVKPATSFSQAQAGPGGIVQASSSSISNGNFGSIAGFTSANGADSTFSFNIRPKPDKTQNRPTAYEGNYGLPLPHRNTWYPQNSEYPNSALGTGEQISAYDLPFRETINSPFSTSNAQAFYIRNKTGPQRKEALTLTQDHEVDDYDYIGRTLRPLSNVTTDDEIQDKDQDYEYDEDYATSPLLRKFNQDGYLRPEHMIGTVLKADNDITEVNSMNMTATTSNNTQTFDDNYVLPVLNRTKELSETLPNPLNISFTDALAKHFNNHIFAEDKTDDDTETNDNKNIKTTDHNMTNILQELQRRRNRNRIKNNLRNHESIAFAPLNILTKPERPDNWVFFEATNKEEPLLPQIPEINIDPVPSAEVPKPIKQNIWLDLVKIKQKLALQLKDPSGHLIQQTENRTKPEPTRGPFKDFTTTINSTNSSGGTNKKN